MSRVKTHAKYLLILFHFRVPTRSGAESIIHGARRWVNKLGDNNQYGMLQVDLRKSFDFVSRRVILRETHR